MKTITINKIKKEVQKRLPLNRFKHAERVAEMSIALSKIWGGDPEKLICAAYLHDIARDIPEKELIKIAKENKYKISEIEYKKPVLLHSIVGAIIAGKDFGITDQSILNAIRYHTTGRKGITINEAIIYIADFTEYGRTFKEAKIVREISFKNLKEAVLKETEFNTCFLMSKRKPIHPYSIEMFNDLLKNEIQP